MAERPNLLTGEDLPPAPRQKRSLAKHARLRKAGLQVFRDKGYEAASIEEVARRAGMAVGGFYQHFRSKRQLLLALMDELLERLAQLNLASDGGGDVRANLHQFLSRALAADLRYLGAYRAWREAALSDPELAGKQRRIHEWTVARISGLLTRLGQLPGARRGVDIQGLAAVLDSMFWDFLARASRMPPAGRARWLAAIVHLIYHAILTSP